MKTLGFFHNDDRKDPWVIGDFTAMPLLTDQSKVSMLPTSIDGLIIIPYDDPNEFGKTIFPIISMIHEWQKNKEILKHDKKNLEFLGTQKKKDDLCDAFLQGAYYLSKN